MVPRIKIIVLASFLAASMPIHANNDQGWSLAPAKAVMMTFWATIAVVGNPDIGSIMYRYLMLSPMALITAGTATVTWNAITNPALLSWLKNRASDSAFIPL